METFLSYTKDKILHITNINIIEYIIIYTKYRNASIICENLDAYFHTCKNLHPNYHTHDTGKIQYCTYMEYMCTDIHSYETWNFLNVP